jgi:V8-like Glu-specific endopeptidase
VKKLLGLFLVLGSLSTFAIRKKYQEPNNLIHKTIVTLSYSKDIKEHFCTATIISDNMILTAAHCLNDIESRQAFVIIRGDSNNDIREYIEISEVKTHPKFEHLGNNTYDIAIAKVKTRFPDYIKPAVIVNKSIFRTKMLFSGGGTSGMIDLETGEVVPLIGKNTGKLQTTAAYAKKFFSKEMIVQPQKNLCVGDSGGPVYKIKNNRIHIYGVASKIKKWTTIYCGSELYFSPAKHVKSLI